jgi:hypothetical protein
MTRSAVTLFAIVSLATGCAGILGIKELGDDVDASTPGDSGTTANDSGRDAIATDSGAPDVAADVAPDVFPGEAGLPLCPPPSAGTVTSAELDWALWPMPNSPVDVEGGAPNLEHYTVNGDGTVTDDVTGLMWQQNLPPADTFVQSGAVGQCAGLSLAGHTDWQLPTYIELASIVDLAQQNPAIDPTAFPSTPAEIYWSSTAAADTTAEWWDVSFINGQTGRDSATGIHHARCVRFPGVTVTDAGAPCTRYVSNAAGTVKDSMTGLTWQVSPSQSFGDTWTGAAPYCAQLNVSGVTGWRVPTASELLTLVDVMFAGPALDPSAFSTMLNENFWSASPQTGSPGNAWDISLGPGSRGTAVTTLDEGVRCVH